MLDEYQLQNMDHTRCRSRSCNWVPFSVLCGYISYNHSDDVLPAHLALILDVPGRWAILENTHCYHCSPGVCGYCHGPQQKFWEGCVKVTHSNEICNLQFAFGIALNIGNFSVGHSLAGVSWHSQVWVTCQWGKWDGLQNQPPNRVHWNHRFCSLL